ncbi:alpha/beta fold hydrolase [Streptomyces palmae]|uniref:Alpha/beta hydrolase n=1 Tax=Streptomyces palmae TaxID=1701085 RepID=A0A4Z0H9T5_9ACTN|nr:alpha/beta hydrolase [Streptomyces palmae]TGB05573.1 alpha/beta hydrolase [Streptomyces palmae]
MDLSVPVDDEVTLRVRHRPGAGGRPFLLVHGLGSNARMWDEVADRLADAGHPVYAVDMRGHGDSDAPEDGYDNATAVADLAALCRAAGLTGVLLAGHSWGGNVAIRLAAEHAELVTGLALVDGGWVDLTETASWETWAAHVSRRRPDATGTTPEAMRDFLRALHPTWSPTAIEANLADLRVGPDGLLAPRLPTARFLSLARSLYEDPPARWYPRVRVPVMLLNAIPAASPSWARWVRHWAATAEAAIPRTDSRWYPDTDHNLHAEHPQRLASDLLDLARTVGPLLPARS